MLDMLKAGVNYILDLGAAAMLPIILSRYSAQCVKFQEDLETHLRACRKKMPT